MNKRDRNTKGKESKSQTRRLPGPGGGRHRGLGGERAEDTKGAFNRIWNYLRKESRSITLVFFLVIGATTCNLLGPFLMGRAIDSFIARGDIAGLARMALLMVSVYLGGSFLNWLQTFIMVGVSQRTLREIRSDLFRKLQELSLSFFDERPHGELMSRMTNDVETINLTLTQSVTQLISSLLTVLGVVAMMLVINYKLALVTLLTVPLVALIARYVARYTRKAFSEQQRNIGDLNGLIEETITGQRVVKLFCREREMLERFEQRNEDYRTSSTRAGVLASLMGPLMGLVNNLSFAVVAGVGGWMAVGGVATVGTIAAFLNYTRQFGHPLNRLASLYNTVQSALAGAERIFEIIDQEPELQDEPGAEPIEKVKGEVTFAGVDFSYEEGVPVLKNVSFRAEPGEMVALVGPTGAGKTTIVNLLTRFYDIDEGAIYVDGKDIREIEIDSLRSQLGIVLQDTYLFSGTVEENIRFGRLAARKEEVEEAAKKANADRFIRHLPRTYETELSEEGANLSQGQRQLISIARALLADPAILILDEATSSVDTRTEIHIQKAMKKLMKGRTSFVIAHRLDTIRNADKILVIKGGEIVETGTHGELLAKEGFYHELHNSRFQDADVINQ